MEKELSPEDDEVKRHLEVNHIPGLRQAPGIILVGFRDEQLVLVKLAFYEPCKTRHRLLIRMLSAQLPRTTETPVQD